MTFMAAVTTFVLALFLGGGTSDFRLSLTRQYGRSAFTNCRLHLVVFEGKGTTELRCAFNSPPDHARPLLSVREDLSSEETRRLASAVDRAALFQGGHVGADDTAVDGVFETLKVTSGSRTVVLVTSGNPTFESDAARKELLSQLKAFEQRLLARARQQERPR